MDDTTDIEILKMSHVSIWNLHKIRIQSLWPVIQIFPTPFTIGVANVVPPLADPRLFAASTATFPLQYHEIHLHPLPRLSSHRAPHPTTITKQGRTAFAGGYRADVETRFGFEVVWRPTCGDRASVGRVIKKDKRTTWLDALHYQYLILQPEAFFLLLH